MATTYKVLGQVDVAATTEATLYTVPAVTTSVLSTLVVCNRGIAGTFRVSVSVAGAATDPKDYLYYDHALDANDTFTVTLGLTLGAADKVRVYASTTDFSFSAFGAENT
jgi:hypothetical protein